MKKLSKWVILLALAVVLTACGSSDEATGEDSVSNEGAEGESYDLKMSITVGNNTSWYEGAQKLADDVKEASDGRINITVYTNEQLAGGDSAGTVEQLMNGLIDMSYNSTIIYSIMDERFGVLSAPFLFTDLEATDEALAGAGGEAINEILRENNVEPLGFGQNGFRQISNSQHPIQTPADLENMKVRIPGISMYTDLFRELGADPTTMTFSEVFTSLQQGTIDAQENPIDVFHSAQLAEVQDYITLWNYSYDPIVLGINKDLFESMSAEDQEILRTAAVEANALQIQVAREREADQIAELQEQGVEFYEPTEDELELFRQAVEPVYEKYESVWGADLLNSFR
ncbi:DctP family TRAP transporter solute-binding subunit [Alkalihalobacillus sp. MEB130]|uniref:DctP family TRAP transporter solute-binding subunit n=1 Tax=Alkalihalobacillus sp. MEB130 TaxID=2976704 RepID=UPI0028E041B3|nr:DctP family TRAP transporter solute-binding subunit [Alkalihalobacillus sp. MEB130]MDT8858899.1 DctP family TRAP transporter solute-binding subunit [Alkalihalobacillus sp. MEB130]